MSDALTEAAAATLARDTLWRNPPPLAPDCAHELELLPVVEPRFTVTCRKCGGLDTEGSRTIQEIVLAYWDRPEHEREGFEDVSALIGVMLQMRGEQLSAPSADLP